MRFLIVTVTAIISTLLMVSCGQEFPFDQGGDIVDIKFSSSWNSQTEQLGDPAISFPYGIKKVYYEVTFEHSTSQYILVKKNWQLPNSQTLQACCIVNHNSGRICGELHYYNETVNMDQGEYTISVRYCESGQVKEYGYAPGVNRTFQIQ